MKDNNHISKDEMLAAWRRRGTEWVQHATGGYADWAARRDRLDKRLRRAGAVAGIALAVGLNVWNAMAARHYDRYASPSAAQAHAAMANIEEILS